MSLWTDTTVLKVIKKLMSDLFRCYCSRISKCPVVVYDIQLPGIQYPCSFMKWYIIRVYGHPFKPFQTPRASNPKNRILYT